MATSLKKDLEEINQRLRQHSKDVDSTAIAVELLKAAEFRKGRDFSARLEASVCLIFALEQRVIARENQRSNFQTWLRTSDLSSVIHQSMEEKTHGTCQWIWTHLAFLNWRSLTDDTLASDRLLLVSGGPGCGKTVLACSIADSMKHNGKRVLFFSFSGSDATRQTPVSLVRSLLWQILHDSNSDEAFTIIQDLMAKGVPLISDLWNALTRIIALVPEPIVMIVDALDECQDPSSMFVKQIVDFLNIVRSARGIIFGRQHAVDIACPNTIEITPELIQADIDTLVRTSISESSNLQSLGILDIAFDSIQRESQGMFLWVKFMIFDLDKPCSKAEVLQRLRNLPSGLQRTYRELLLKLVDSLDQLDRRFVQHVLSLVITARRPLKLDELKYALAVIAWARHQPDGPPLEDFVVGNLANRIRRVCGSLIRIHDNIVSITHLSVQEYLTRPADEWSGDEHDVMSCFGVELIQAHQRFSDTCLDYLIIGDFGSPLTSEGQIDYSGNRSLLEYASGNLTYHLNRSMGLVQGLSAKFERFTKSAAFLSWIEYMIMGLLEDSATGWEVQELLDFVLFLREKESGEVILDQASASIVSELKKRQNTYGLDDWRTGQMSFLIQIFKTNSQDQGRIEVDREDSKPDHGNLAHASQRTPLIVHRSIPENAWTQAPELINAFANDTLTLPKQFAMILKLHVHLQKFKTLTDPLELLYRTIVQHAGKLAVLAIIAIWGFAYRMGRYEVALQLCQTALSKQKKRGVPLELLILNCIGETQWALSRVEDSATTFSTALNLAEKILSPEQPNPLLGTAEWVLALRKMEMLKTPERILRKAVRARQRFRGKDQGSNALKEADLDEALDALNKFKQSEASDSSVEDDNNDIRNLRRYIILYFMRWKADALYYLERYSEAEVVDHRVVEITKEVRGRDHYKTWDALGNLGMSLLNQSKYTDAEAVITEELEARMNEFPIRDGGALERAVCNLQDTLTQQGKLEEASNVWQRVGDLARKALDPCDDDTLQTLEKLANFLHNLGHYREAVASHRRVLQYQKKNHPHGDSKIVTSMWCLGESLYAGQEYPEAESLFRCGLQMQQEYGKPEDTGVIKTLELMKSLEKSLHRQKKYAEAEDMLRSIVEIKEKSLGTENKSTIRWRELVGERMCEQGKFAEAETEFRALLETKKTLYGDEDESTIKSLVYLGRNLYKQGKFAEAETKLQPVVEEKKKILGVDHPIYLKSMEYLEKTLYKQGKYAESEVILRQLLESDERLYGSRSKITQDDMRNLLWTLSKLGKWDEWKAMNARLCEIEKSCLSMASSIDDTSLDSVDEVSEEESFESESASDEHTPKQPQTALVTGWKGSVSEPAFQHFLAATKAHSHQSGSSGSLSQRRSSW